MLRYSCRINKGDTLSNIPFKELYISPDLSFISGTTDSNLTISGTHKVLLKNSFETSECDVEWSEATRQGLCIINVPFKVKEFTIDSVTHKYIEYNDNFCYIQEDENGKFIVLPFYYDYVFNVDENRNIIQYNTNFKLYVDNDVEIVIPISLCIEDGYINYKNNTYPIETDIDGNSYVVKNDTDGYFSDAKVVKLNKEDFLKVRKFIIYRPSDNILSIEDITGGKYNLFCVYDNKKYHITKQNVNGIIRIGCNIDLLRIENNKTKTETTWIDAYTINYNDSNNAHIVLTGSTAQDVDIRTLRGNDLFMNIDGTVYPVKEQIVNSINNDNLIVYIQTDKHNLNINDTFYLSYSSPTEYDEEIFTDDANKQYVIHNNQKYYFQQRCCDSIIINQEEFDLFYPNGYEDGKIAYADVYGVRIDGEIINNGTLFKRRYNIPNGRNFTDTIYTITNNDGFVIDNKRYTIVHEGQRATVRLNDSRKIRMRVTDKIGASTLLCAIDLDKVSYSDNEYKKIVDYFNRLLIDIKHKLVIEYESKIFGDRKFTAELPWVSTTLSTIINTSYDYYNLNEKLNIYDYSAYCRISIPLTISSGGNPLHDNILENQFFESERRNVITNIVDMEKEVYYPVYPVVDNNGNLLLDSNGMQRFINVRSMEFNLHFRTRDEESWKIIEDDGPNGLMHNMSNWFITDYEPYKHLLGTDGDKIQESSDLLGLLFFTNNDVYYQKDKIGKTFLRLSFYDGIDPMTQNLLATSTIFFDESKTFKKYMNNISGFDTNIMFQNVDKDLNNISTTIGVKTESCYNDDNSKMKYLWDDSKRLSSKFSVVNKYENNDSSEGFYIYMFREYATSMHPSKLYMKVEFNHAGLGKTLLFTLPTSKDGHVLKLSNKEDLRELKEGVNINEIHKHSYIPLTAIYDKSKRQYAYYVDTNYISPSVIQNKNGHIQFNLFEMKIKSE